jgi:hypothetical protein
MPLAPKGSKANLKTPPTKAAPKTFKPSSRPAAKADAKKMVSSMKDRVKAETRSEAADAGRKVESAGKRLVKSGGVPKGATKKALSVATKAYKAKSK